MFYIMTLGTVRYYRNRGIASMLVEKAIRDVVEGDEACGVVYLHVITYNERAIGFYERLGFVRVKEIQDYYRINGENYNCYLYAKYFHGNRGHWTIMSYLSSIVSSVWKRFTNVVAPPPPPSSSGSTLKNNSNGNSNSNGSNGYI
uniref:N-alpha-acetyltransferase 60 n=1 Tax=Helicotheca tamesis TaxID=374047 RepID=A0A7S2N4T1_9STRA